MRKDGYAPMVEGRLLLEFWSENDRLARDKMRYTDDFDIVTVTIIVGERETKDAMERISKALERISATLDTISLDIIEDIKKYEVSLRVDDREMFWSPEKHKWIVLSNRTGKELYQGDGVPSAMQCLVWGEE